MSSNTQTYRGFRISALRTRPELKNRDYPIEYCVLDPRDGTVLASGIRHRDWSVYEVMADLRALVDVVRSGLTSEENEEA